jgi:hypothetical protein
MICGNVCMIQATFRMRRVRIVALLSIADGRSRREARCPSVWRTNASFRRMETSSLFETTIGSAETASGWPGLPGGSGRLLITWLRLGETPAHVANGAPVPLAVPRVKGANDGQLCG